MVNTLKLGSYSIDHRSTRVFHKRKFTRISRFRYIDHTFFQNSTMAVKVSYWNCTILDLTLTSIYTCLWYLVNKSYVGLRHATIMGMLKLWLNIRSSIITLYSENKNKRIKCRSGLLIRFRIRIRKSRPMLIFFQNISKDDSNIYRFSNRTGSGSLSRHVHC